MCNSGAVRESVCNAFFSVCFFRIVFLEICHIAAMLVSLQPKYMLLSTILLADVYIFSLASFVACMRMLKIKNIVNLRQIGPPAVQSYVCTGSCKN